MAQRHKMPDGHFVCSPLVAGVHGLGGAQNLGNLGLGQVVVLPQSPHFFNECPHNAVSLLNVVWPKFSKVQIFTIYFNK